MSMPDPAPQDDRLPLCGWLDEQSSRLDAATLDRINVARRRALDAAARPGRRRTAPWLAGAALAGVAALALWPIARQDQAPPAPVPMETFRMLATPGELELLQSLDFYLWLEADEAAAATEDSHAG